MAMDFKKSLSSAVEVNGELHSSFNMLQNVVTIFHTLHDRGKDVVCCKKVQLTKSSNDFDLMRKVSF